MDFCQPIAWANVPYNIGKLPPLDKQRWIWINNKAKNIKKKETIFRAQNKEKNLPCNFMRKVPLISLSNNTITHNNNKADLQIAFKRVSKNVSEDRTTKTFLESHKFATRWINCLNRRNNNHLNNHGSFLTSQWSITMYLGHWISFFFF